MGESKLPKRPKAQAPKGAVSQEVLDAADKFILACEADLSRNGIHVKDAANVYGAALFVSGLAVQERYKPEPMQMIAAISKGVAALASTFKQSPLAWIDYIGTKLEETHTRG